MKRPVAWNLSGLVAGIVFGLGLSISQMTNPEKVQSFLDLFGNWDPSLLFTMGSAVVVTFLGYRMVLNRGPVFGEKLHLPGKSDIDMRLLSGALIFGVGWGFAGYCPGPAITGISGGLTEPVIFVAAMVLGAFAEKARSAAMDEK